MTESHAGLSKSLSVIVERSHVHQVEQERFLGAVRRLQISILSDMGLASSKAQTQLQGLVQGLQEKLLHLLAKTVHSIHGQVENLTEVCTWLPSEPSFLLITVLDDQWGVSRG